MKSSVLHKDTSACGLKEGGNQTADHMIRRGSFPITSHINTTPYNLFSFRSLQN